MHDRVLALLLMALLAGCERHGPAPRETGLPPAQPRFVEPAVAGNGDDGDLYDHDQRRHPECYRPVRHHVSDLPRLVAALADATPTDTPTAFWGFAAVGDEATLVIVDEIIPDLPIDRFLPEPYAARWAELGAGAYYEYVRAAPAHRAAFREAVRCWIEAASADARRTWGTRRWVPVLGY